MPFTGDEDHGISLKEAAKLTKNYRETPGTSAFLAAFFGKTALSAILNQQDCAGIRIYNALKENGDPNFVLVGVTADGEDMEDGIIAEYGMGCPPSCPDESALAGTA